MPYDIYGNPLRIGYCEVHPNTRGDYPCADCLDETYNNNPQPEQPYPTNEEMCAPHNYYGDDDQGGRCYCGGKRYPFDGPKIDKPVIIAEERLNNGKMHSSVNQVSDPRY